MSNTVDIETLEQLKAFLNEKGVMEIAIRSQNKRFKGFQKAMISNLPGTQEKELTQKVIQALNKNTLLNERNLKLLGDVAKVGKIGILLNGLNLCATCGGFEIMYKKLGEMSSEIKQLEKIIKQTQDIQNDYEFNKVVGDHTDMLDCQRKQQPYSEEKMRELVDREYSVLKLLIDSFQKDTSENYSVLIFLIFSMLAMFTVSLRSFDELYYFNNRQALGEKDPWHMSHGKWTSVYGDLSKEWFVEKLQDYGMFKIGLSTQKVDVYYISLLDQLAELRGEIEDNQKLIIAIGDIELFRQFKKMSAKEVVDSIESAYREAGSDLDEETVRVAYQNAIKQAPMEEMA